jgi:taurine dioxygenase
VSLTMNPLSEGLGIEVTGIDFSKPVAAPDVDAMTAALHENLVMVIRDQDLTTQQYLDAMRLFGELMPQHLTNLLMQEHPEIAVLDSRNSVLDSDGKGIPIGSRDWHTDHTNHDRPPKMTAMYAIKLPSKGGDTGFANMQAAFAALPPVTQAALSAMTTVNVIEKNTIYVSDDVREALTEEPQRHPLIRTHPETGRKAIYVHPGKTERIEGMQPAESLTFINDLLDRVLTPAVTYRHKWRSGDVVIWDNRGVLHLAHRDYDHREGRIMHRVILEGEVPF